MIIIINLHDIYSGRCVDAQYENMGEHFFTGQGGERMK